jgi:peptidoglycan/LPS O-acetylase OafA/YrhL
MPSNYESATVSNTATGDFSLSEGQYRPEIDGLRAVAVLAVVAFHTFPGLAQGGFAGVDVFFVISGYLITDILLRRQTLGSVPLAEFYGRRAVRILPALVSMLLISLILGAVLQSADEFSSLGLHTIAAASFASNWLLASEVGYFDTAAELKPLLHLWSLAVEEQFYFAWPVLLVVTAKLSSPWRRAAVVALTATSFTLGLYLSQESPIAGFYSPLSRGWELFAGALLALVLTRVEHAGRRPFHLVLPLSLAETLPWVGLIMVLISLSTLHHGKAPPGWGALTPVLGSVLLLASPSTAWVHRRLLAHPCLVFIGRVSYPWYLWHWPMLVMIRPYVETAPIHWKAAIKLAIVCASFGVAVLTWRWIERPLRRWFESAARRSALATLGTGLALAGIAGAAIVALDGVPIRAPDRVYGQAALIAETKRVGVCSASGFDGCVSSAQAWKDIEFLFVGDSHAFALYLGAPASRAAYLGSFGCFPAQGLQSLNRIALAAPDCSAYGRLSAILALLPALKTVTIAARGPMYLQGQGFGWDQARYDWKLQSPDEAAGSGSQTSAGRGDQMSRGLSRMIDSLLAARPKPRVVLTLPIPELGFNIEECVISRPLDRLSRRRQPCAVSRPMTDIRHADYRALVKALHLQRREDFDILDPLSTLCDERWCSAQRDNTFLYADADHLAPLGARALLAHHPGWSHSR